MQKPLIEALLQKFAQGDISIQDKLCSQLAERLMVVPALGVEDEASGAIRVKVLQIKVEEQPAVACFTSDKRFKEWKALFDFQYEKLDLLGVDLCTVLGRQSFLLVDPNSDHEALLKPETVARIISLAAPTDTAIKSEDEMMHALRGTGGKDKPIPVANRVFEGPDYETDTFIHNNALDGMLTPILQVVQKPFTDTPLEPLPPEAAELPPEVAQRVAKLVAQKNRTPSGTNIPQPTLPAEDTDIVAEAATAVNDSKKRSLFDLLRGTKKQAT